jgi:predicted AAA+ superfamily ATPase
MYQVLKELVENDVIDLRQIVFIDFSEILENKIDFLKILEDFYSIYPDLEPFFVFDEVQEIDNFKE